MTATTTTPTPPAQDGEREQLLRCQVDGLKALLADIRDDVKEAYNYSILDDTRNQTKVVRYFEGKLARIDAALDTPAKGEFT